MYFFVENPLDPLPLCFMGYPMRYANKSHNNIRRQGSLNSSEPINEPPMFSRLCNHTEQRGNEGGIAPAKNATIREGEVNISKIQAPPGLVPRSRLMADL